jgi:hypothetical protein
MEYRSLLGGIYFWVHRELLIFMSIMYWNNVMRVMASQRYIKEREQREEKKGIISTYGEAFLCMHDFLL